MLSVTIVLPKLKLKPPVPLTVRPKVLIWSARFILSVNNRPFPVSITVPDPSPPITPPVKSTLLTLRVAGVPAAIAPNLLGALIPRLWLRINMLPSKEWNRPPGRVVGPWIRTTWPPPRLRTLNVLILQLGVTTILKKTPPTLLVVVPLTMVPATSILLKVDIGLLVSVLPYVLSIAGCEVSL